MNEWGSDDDESDDGYNDDDGDDFRKKALSLIQFARSTDTKNVLLRHKHFLLDSVRSWNPTIDEVLGHLHEGRAGAPQH